VSLEGGDKFSNPEPFFIIYSSGNAKWTMLSEVYPKFIYQIKIVQSLLLENTKFTTTITNTLQC